jgi:hypothetical protein
MKPVYRTWVPAIALRQSRNTARTLALLALLANAALLPALHLAVRSVAVAAHGAAALHNHKHDDSGNEPAGTNHQVCHFCRLLGVALPPPPLTVIGLVSAPHDVERMILNPPAAG